MVLLFSNRNSKLEKEIIEILTAYGANLISDKEVYSVGGFFNVTPRYKHTKINIKKGIVVILDDTEKYSNQIFPQEIIGICEDTNSNALKIFKNNGVPVVVCGNNPKNTLTISSIDNKDFLITLQREIIDVNGKILYPADFKMCFNKLYSPQAVMICCGILNIIGIKP